MNGKKSFRSLILLIILVALTACGGGGSPSGRYVVFSSDATNLVVEDTIFVRDIFVRDTQTGTTTRVSVGLAGAEGDDESNNPAVSTDGRYVAFESYATNLVTGDTNTRNDIFVRDTQTGVTTRVSVDSAGAEGNNDSFSPGISADGRYVAFYSFASNLVAGDSNGSKDIFVRDTQTGITTRVSVDSAGVEGNDNSQDPTISANGRYVAFHSTATNFVVGDNNAASDIFVHDTQTGITIRVSVDSASTQGNGGSFSPVLSAAGRYVAFYSSASNLVAVDTNARDDIFVHDTQTGVTTRASVDSAGTEGNNGSTMPAISADGRYVAFQSNATNLVAGDSNLTKDIFLHDTQTGVTTRVSVDSAGIEGNVSSNDCAISADGRYVAFYSNATNLVVGDSNVATDIFMHDTQTGVTTRVSVDSAGAQGDDDSYSPDTK